MAQAGISSAATALAAMPALDDGSTLAGVVMVSGPPGQPTDVRQLSPTNRAAAAFRDIASTAVAAFKQCEVISYGPATSTVGDQTMWMSLEDLPLVQAIADDTTDLASLEEFDPALVRPGDVRLSALRMEAKGQPVVLLQAMPQGQLAARSRKFGVVIRRGQIDVPRDPVFLLGRDVLAIVTGNFVFFTDRPGFQKIFGLLQEIQAKAAQTLQEVTENLEIDGFDTMLSAVGSSPSMLGKMASIQRKLETHPQYKQAMTMPNLVKFVKAHPECGVELSGTGANAKLVFHNDPQHRFKILKLLDDDLLRSELTALEYDANSKSDPIAP